MVTLARTADLRLTEFGAFNDGQDLPVMRQWELPFALFQSRLSSTMSVLDCTINPVNFGDRLHALYPHVLYRHWNPIQGGRFLPPLSVPDEAFDRVTCVNTLEHLLRAQREALIAEMSRKLKPGGLLVVTCDHYFDGFWENPWILQMRVIRADREEVFDGWNKVAPVELLEICARHGLVPINDAIEEPRVGDPSLYRNVEPYPHACIGAVFHKPPRPALPPRRRLVLSLLTWNTKDTSLESLWAYVQEARMLQRLGHEPLIVVSDNGSTDGTQEAMRSLDGYVDVPYELISYERNRGNCIPRNRVIDLALAAGADYVLFMDGDIEIVPFSSYAMLRHMEDSGHLLGCLGPHSFGHTPLRGQANRYLFSVAGSPLEVTNLVAWTQYGMFRREIFEAGVRFDENDPFDREGWGFEDNDLAFQMYMKSYHNQSFFGMTYLHRHPHSSVRAMRAIGIDPNTTYARRKEYVIKKWASTQAIDHGPLDHVRSVNEQL